MSHLPDYFEHLVRERGLDQFAAAERVAVVQNKFDSDKQRRAFFGRLADRKSVV